MLALSSLISALATNRLVLLRWPTIPPIHVTCPRSLGNKTSPSKGQKGPKYSCGHESQTRDLGVEFGVLTLNASCVSSLYFHVSSSYHKYI